MKDDGKIVIYDGECLYCGLACRMVQKLEEDIEIVDWNSEFSQSFLDAQFDSIPFSIFFIDTSKNKLWVGDDAIRMIESQSEYTEPGESLFSENYKFISSAVSKLSGRDRDIDRDYSGTYELTEDAIRVMNS